MEFEIYPTHLIEDNSLTDVSEDLARSILFGFALFASLTALCILMAIGVCGGYIRLLALCRLIMELITLITPVQFCLALATCLSEGAKVCGADSYSNKSPPEILAPFFEIEAREMLSRILIEQAIIFSVLLCCLGCALFINQAVSVPKCTSDSFTRENEDRDFLT